ncbi:hypothetical protein BUC_1657 [Burkholderia pseudomallei 576]|nr:hypothetical protein BUC_1657 [Burkholderia pseudomallei 576]
MRETRGGLGRGRAACVRCSNPIDVIGLDRTAHRSRRPASRGACAET